MKLSRKIIALCLGATLALGSTFGLAACNGNNDDTGSAGDPNIRLVYNMYVENCAAKGEEALTYEDWLASIKGEDGKDGVTPHIDDETGYWFIGDKNTGIKAAGSNGTNGVTPHIGENGNWFIGDEDSHVPATGAKGDPGDDGTNGTSFLHGKGKPDAALGSEGDLYLDLETYDLYEKTAEGWSTDPVGNIKGAKGDKGDKGDSATGGDTEPVDAVKTWSNVTINANGTYDLDVTGIEEGHYWLVAKTETTAAANVLTESYTVESDVIPYDMYSSLTKSFKGFAYISSTATVITLTNKSEENISGDFALVEYTPVDITTGQEVEIPVPLNKSPTKGNLASYTFDKSLVGQSVKISFSYLIDAGIPVTRYIKNDESNGSINPAWKADNDQIDGVWCGTRTIPADALRLAITVKETAGCNAVVKIELAS